MGEVTQVEFENEAGDKVILGIIIHRKVDSREQIEVDIVRINRLDEATNIKLSIVEADHLRDALDLIFAPADQELERRLRDANSANAEDG